MKFLVLLILIEAVLGVQFLADIEELDPAIVGTMTGSMFYDDANRWIKITYNTPGRYAGFVTDITNYNTDNTGSVSYLRCSGTCDAESISWALPVFTVGADGGGGSITVDGRTCRLTTFGANSGNTRAVHRLWTSGGLPCVAEFGGSGNVRKFTFRNVRTGAAAGAVPNWGAEIAGCPAKECKVQMDIIFVLDESGSISSTDWTRAKDFVKAVIDRFEIAANAVRVGVTTFDDQSRVRIPLDNYEKNSLKNSVTNLSQRGGLTCIPCGMSRGLADSQRWNRPVFRLMIVITDGINNEGDAQIVTVANQCDQHFSLILAIGVGNNINTNQLNIVASTPSGQYPKTVYLTPSFTTLQTEVGNLVSATCQDLPGNPCGSGCKGFCACKGTAQFRACICPSTCDDSLFCTSETCSENVNSAGCTYPPRVCNDQNVCTDDFCDEQNRTCRANLKNIDVFCNDNNACTIPSCDPVAGCQYVQRTCNDNDPCTSDSCNSNGNPSNPCVFTPIPCDKCNLTGTPKTCPAIPCQINQCVPATGNCSAVDKVCNDNSVCTTDSCNTNTDQCVFTPIPCNDNNVCTTDTCNPTTGCAYTADVSCDDQNPCTIDSCDPTLGCVRTPVNCADTDNCTDDFCKIVNATAYICENLPKKCETDPFIVAKIGTCYIAKCNFTITNQLNEQGLVLESGGNGCYIEQIANTTVDECGCCEGVECFCGNVAPPKDDSGVVGGVALAAILLAVLGVVGIAALLGGKKGYDVYLKNRANFAASNTNPLYNAKGMAGSNPMYSNPNDAL